MQRIELQWLTRPTGNPFVDTGGYVIELLREKYYPGEDILSLINKVALIYVHDWKAKLNSFFHNSTITQPAYKGDRKIEETIKFFSALIEDRLDYIEGFCQITGRKTKLFAARVDNSPLAGSMGFVNYHSFFDQGIRVSKEVLIRMFFVPLGSVGVGGKVGVVSSNSPEFTKLFVSKNLSENMKSASSGGGLYKLPYSGIENALFYYADELLRERKDIEGDVAITLYHFSSYMQSPSLSIYRLPANVFAFYRYAIKNHPDEWRRFLHSHYRYPKRGSKDVEFDAISDRFVIRSKKAEDFVDYEEFKTWHNDILRKLLREQSILVDILRWLRKGNAFPFNLVKVYSIKILGMKKATVSKIKELASSFVELAQKNDRLKRYLNTLNSATSASELRRFLITLVRENYLSGNEQPLITVEDYVNYLFSDDTGWAEIRDLLLIAIYEELHTRQIKLDIEEN